MNTKKSPYRTEVIRKHSREQFSVLKHDPEVRKFVIECLKTMTFAETSRACKAHFGEDRAPSRSAIHRYWQKNKTAIQEIW